MSRIKLLYALESAGGGTLKHVTYLATRLSPDEFEITLVLPNENYEKDTKAAVLLLREKGLLVETVRMKKQVSLYDLFTLFRVYSFIQKHRFDMIHAHSSKAGVIFRVVAWCAKIPVLYTPHCFYFTAHAGLKRWFYAGVERILANITQCIVISGTEQQSVQKEHITASRIMVIDNAIDPDEYQMWDTGKVRLQWNIPENHHVIVGVGRLVKQKGWDVFIKAAEMVLLQNSNVRFMIVGEGPDHHILYEMINQRGLAANIRLCGHLDDVSQIYSIADIFVSTSKWEGLPYTYLEALHFNIPMLIMYTEGMEYFSELTGHTFIPQSDYNYLGKEIARLLSKLSEKSNRKEVEIFSIIQFIEQHRILYHQLANAD